MTTPGPTRSTRSHPMNGIPARHAALRIGQVVLVLQGGGALGAYQARRLPGAA